MSTDAASPLSHAYKVRRATVDDLQAMLDITQAVLPDLIGDESELAITTDFVDSFDRDFHAGFARFVAERDGNVVGFAEMRPCTSATEGPGVSKSMVLNNIGVLEAHQSKGVGRALHKRVRNAAQYFGARMLIAQVPDSSIDFYRSVGWTVATRGRSVAWMESFGGPAVTGQPITDEHFTTVQIRYMDPEAHYPNVAYRVMESEFIAHVWEFDYAWDAPSTPDNAGALAAANQLCDDIVETPVIARFIPEAAAQILIASFELLNQKSLTGAMKTWMSVHAEAIRTVLSCPE